MYRLDLKVIHRVEKPRALRLLGLFAGLVATHKECGAVNRELWLGRLEMAACAG